MYVGGRTTSGDPGATDGRLEGGCEEPLNWKFSIVDTTSLADGLRSITLPDGRLEGACDAARVGVGEAPGDVSGEYV